MPVALDKTFVLLFSIELECKIGSIKTSIKSEKVYVLSSY